MLLAGKCWVQFSVFPRRNLQAREIAPDSVSVIHIITIIMILITTVILIIAV